MQILDLSCSNMENIDVECISRAKWPMLSSLDISHNTLLPLATSVEDLVSADWPQLTHLDISGWTKLTAADMQTLATSHWPLLQSLALGGLVMKTAMFRNMSGGNWPILEKLDISSARGISIPGFQWLCKGNWPKMSSISFQDCKLGLNACDGMLLCTLASANWPVLHTLDLSGNTYCYGFHDGPDDYDEAHIASSIVELLRATWPGMRNLWLSESGQPFRQMRLDLSKLTAPVPRVFDYCEESRPGKPPDGMYAIMAASAGL